LIKKKCKKYLEVFCIDKASWLQKCFQNLLGLGPMKRCSTEFDVLEKKKVEKQ